MSIRTKIGVGIVGILLCAEVLTAQEWNVPAEKSIVLSPFAFSGETSLKGASLFNTNCKSCHGDPGKGNVLALNPPPPDPAGEKMQKNKDGEIYFKVREGHGAMPSFKNSLSSEAIWSIISYFRSFNKGYKQEISKMIRKAGKTSIQLTWIKEDHKVEAFTVNENNRVVSPLEGAEVQAFVHRSFGKLPVDQVKTSDQEGKVVFTLPNDIPGDSLGNLMLSLSLADEMKYGEVKVDTTIQAGIPTWSPPLNSERAMWNTVQKAPYWLLITYLTVVLTIWAFILYVLYHLRMVYLIGKKDQLNQQ